MEKLPVWLAVLLSLAGALAIGAFSLKPPKPMPAVIVDTVPLDYRSALRPSI